MQREVTTRRIHRLVALAPDADGRGAGGRRGRRAPPAARQHALRGAVPQRAAGAGAGRASAAPCWPSWSASRGQAGRRTLCLESDLAPARTTGRRTRSRRSTGTPRRWSPPATTSTCRPATSTRCWRGLEADAAAHAARLRRADLVGRRPGRLGRPARLPVRADGHRRPAGRRRRRGGGLGRRAGPGDLPGGQGDGPARRRDRGGAPGQRTGGRVHRARGRRAHPRRRLPVGHAGADRAPGHRLGQLVKAANLRALRARAAGGRAGW